MGTSASASPEKADTTRVSAEALLAQLASLFRFGASSPDFAALPREKTPPATTREPPSAAARYRTLVEQIPAVIFTAFLDAGSQ